MAENQCQWVQNTTVKTANAAVYTGTQPCFYCVFQRLLQLVLGEVVLNGKSMWAVDERECGHLSPRNGYFT